VAGIIPWVVVGICPIGPRVQVYAPGFVYGIFGSHFIFLNPSELNQCLQHCQLGRWRDELVG
jgi:hypothetical protein